MKIIEKLDELRITGRLSQPRPCVYGYLGDEVAVPHIHADGKFAASMNNRRERQVRVDTMRELIELVGAGFSVRMAVPGCSRTSLLSPKSLHLS